MARYDLELTIYRRSRRMWQLHVVEDPRDVEALRKVLRAEIKRQGYQGGEADFSMEVRYRGRNHVECRVAG